MTFVFILLFLLFSICLSSDYFSNIFVIPGSWLSYIPELHFILDLPNNHHITHRVMYNM